MNDDDMPEYEPGAKAALLRALEDQLKSPETPEVRAELDRLLADGSSKQEAKEMMATILSFHITSMIQRDKPFDYPAYVAELRKLPEIDYDKPL